MKYNKKKKKSGMVSEDIKFNPFHVLNENNDLKKRPLFELFSELAFKRFPQPICLDSSLAKRNIKTSL